MFTAVVLAAGKAERMGALKQLLPWKGKTILETVVQNLLNCSEIDDEIRVILGEGRERIRPLLAEYDDSRLEIRDNPDYEEGMLTTINVGLKDLPSETKGIVLALGDQPLIPTEIFNKCIERFKESEDLMLVPTYQSQNGHPVIVSPELLPEIKKLKGPGGLRGLFDRIPDQIEYFPVDDERIIIDFDFYDEYKKYRKREEEKRKGWHLNYKFWLEDKERAFGDGPCDILLRIDRFGSLRQAADDMNMSYSQAWKLLNKMEERLGFKLVTKQAGGSAGGGSTLTEKGRLLMNNFLSFRREIHYSISQLEKKYFNQGLWDRLIDKNND